MLDNFIKRGEDLEKDISLYFKKRIDDLCFKYNLDYSYGMGSSWLSYGEHIEIDLSYRSDIMFAETEIDKLHADAEFYQLIFTEEDYQECKKLLHKITPLLLDIQREASIINEQFRIYNILDFSNLT